ncbi:UpxY family transcription antiterminator [Foetidibacter luteolus]|uniref:UpxY family transcription antiterminator n=1 Tax=Foetidibacter luteolus TaxID=2608880 RepID=UPI00129A0D4D|nr:UpxY family transcription antiterminator [Foetidibacter luteolus]
MNVEKKWYALYTKPRWEKKVDNVLTKKNIESWCPLQKVERQWSDRRKVIEEPLFKSYVFVHISEEDKTNVLRTDGVLNFVYYLGKPAVIRDDEVNLVKTYLLEEDARVSVQSFSSLEENVKVMIKSGVFMHNTGRVLRTANKRVYVRLESLDQVMVVEFPAAHVARV